MVKGGLRDHIVLSPDGVGHEQSRPAATETKITIDSSTKDRREANMPDKVRILLVEDEIALLDTLTDYLRECGYTVYPVTKAEEASAHLRCGIVDLAILDVGAHGLRIAREAMTSDVPAILMSGYPVILEIGAVGDVMRKPFSLALLRTNIEKAMAARGLSGPAKTERTVDQLPPVRLPGSASSGSA
jgi:DNA-binding NtrC family response regulator